jgi:outer membrane beta-barrel protein
MRARPALLLAALLPALATAEERPPPFRKIKDAVIRKAFPVEGTSALFLGIGGGFGQEYTRDLNFALSYRYHLKEYLGVGLTVVGGLTFGSALVEQVREAGQINAVRPEAPLAQAAVELHFVPVYGKFVLFGRYGVHYDLTLSVGVGVAAVKRKEFDGQSALGGGGLHGAFSPAFGVGLRMLFSKGVGLAAEFRDFVWSEKNPLNNNESSIASHYSFTIGPLFAF